MRIGITHAFCWPEVRRGAERFIQELGAALVSRGHDVVVLSAGWEPGSSCLDGLETVRMRRVLRDPLSHEAYFGMRVFPELLGRRFDAVHSFGRHDAVASIRAANVRHGRRTVFTDLGSPDRRWWRGVGRYQSLAVRRVVRSIDVYGCLSRYSLGFLERDWGRTDGVITPGGVSLTEFRPAQSRAAEPTFLFSGALTEPRKGLAELLAALALVAEDLPDVRLWLSGPGNPAELLAAAAPSARKRTEVLDLGGPKEIHERYGRAWATVLPSMHEAFGLVCIESLACGTPIVVTNHGAPQELLAPGVTGEVCRPRDPEDLAAAMRRALRLTEHDATVAACRAAAAPFDWRTSLVPQFEQHYRC